MALYIWKCKACQMTTKKLLTSRPELGNCSCGGKLSFDTDFGQQTMEVIDNGLMLRRLERPTDVESKIKERNELASREAKTNEGVV